MSQQKQQQELKYHGYSTQLDVMWTSDEHSWVTRSESFLILSGVIANRTGDAMGAQTQIFDQY